jgi:hypothetical protein
MRLFLANHLGKKWSSLVEIMAMMAILWLAVTAMFSTVVSGIYLATDSESRIKAINLAREGVEGITNLRNTNWLRFSSDQTNCWRILGYQSGCIWNSGFANGASFWTWATPTSYVLENKNGAWYLTGTTYGTWLWIDDSWYYYASGMTAWDVLCTFEVSTNCRSLFTREIRIQQNPSNTGTINITTIVDWFDRRPQNVTIYSTLTNWKSKF